MHTSYFYPVWVQMNHWRLHCSSSYHGMGHKLLDSLILSQRRNYTSRKLSCFCYQVQNWVTWPLYCCNKEKKLETESDFERIKPKITKLSRISEQFPKTMNKEHSQTLSLSQILISSGYGRAELRAALEDDGCFWSHIFTTIMLDKV